MKPQDIQMVIKLARKLLGYALLPGSKPGLTTTDTTVLDAKLGVTVDDKKIEIWLRRGEDTSANDDNRVFYALNLDGENYMVLYYRQGRWTKYLLQLLQDQEKRGYAAVDDSELFPDINV